MLGSQGGKDSKHSDDETPWLFIALLFNFKASCHKLVLHSCPYTVHSTADEKGCGRERKNG